MMSLLPVRCPRCSGTEVGHEYQVPVVQPVFGFDPEAQDFEYGNMRVDDETVLEDKDEQGRLRMWCDRCLERFWFDPKRLQSEVS